jgi:hypothetical protein
MGVLVCHMFFTLVGDAESGPERTSTGPMGVPPELDPEPEPELPPEPEPELPPEPEPEPDPELAPELPPPPDDPPEPLLPPDPLDPELPPPPEPEEDPVPPGVVSEGLEHAPTMAAAATIRSDLQ